MVEVVDGDYRRAIQEGVHHLHQRVWRVTKVTCIGSGWLEKSSANFTFLPSKPYDEGG